LSQTKERAQPIYRAYHAGDYSCRLLQLRQTRLGHSVFIDDMISCNAVVIFACPKCGMTYRAIQARHRANISDSFDCTKCGTEVYRWSGSYGYSRWTAIRLKSRRRARRHVPLTMSAE
jgi:predicted RNA-binding Zn-ribbon protein involved in translation (DUF1610 family)